MSTGTSTPTQSVEQDSVQAAMDEAWREHQHARDQTWRALQLVILLVAGLIAVEVRFDSNLATIATAALVIFESTAGLYITKHHRLYQIQKFYHITNCEKWLGLDRPDLIGDVNITYPDGTKLHIPFRLPTPISWKTVFSFQKIKDANTVLFIMWMHLGIIGFSLIFTAASIFL